MVLENKRNYFDLKLTTVRMRFGRRQMALLLAVCLASRLALCTVLLQKLHGQVERIPVPGATPLHLILDDLVGVEELLPLCGIQMGDGACQCRSRTGTRTLMLAPNCSIARNSSSSPSTTTTAATRASRVSAYRLIDTVGADHAHIDARHHRLLQIAGILRRQLVAGRRLL